MARASDNSATPPSPTLVHPSLHSAVPGVGDVSRTEALQATADELMRSVSLLRATLDAATDAVIVFDRAGRVMFCNRSFVQLWQLEEPPASGADPTVTLEAMCRLFERPAEARAQFEE